MVDMTQEKPETWDELRGRARLRLLRMHYESGVGHLGGNLSCLDVMLVLHHEILGPADQFVLSKGHSAGAYYVTLWSHGRLDEDDLRQFHKDGTRLSGHPPTSGIEEILFATGSLGHGLSLAAGLALAKRLKGEAGRVYCLTSDGEWNEGSCWEALIFARHHRLDNLTIVVDLNGLQGFGTTREVADLDPLAEKFRAFGVPTREIDGHDRRRDPSGPGDRRAPARGRRRPDAQGMRHLVHGRPDGVALPAADRTPVSPGRPGNRASMRNVFCQSLVEALAPPRVRVPDRRPGLQGPGAAARRAGRAVHQRRRGRAEHGLGRRRPGAGRPAPWVYSIAPFVYARPFEQIRNDVCLHRLPVVLVGNGGGYGYGVMGATHHALEDYGALALPARTCAPTCRRSTATSARRSSDSSRPRTRPTCGWASPRSRRMSRSRPTPPGGG